MTGDQLAEARRLRIESLKRELASLEDETRRVRLELATEGREGFGVDGIRDPDGICASFTNGTPAPDAGCDGDGHHLCYGCSRLDVTSCCGERRVHCICEAER